MKKRKIGIVGTSNSGKTMLLTSLLWHLENHDPSRFELKNDARICNFRLIPRKEHNFAFHRHKNTMLRESRWPEKSMDFSIAECRFQFSGRLRERQLTFVDIPGERISDILLWKSKDYRAWVDALVNFWESDPAIEQIMKDYREAAARTDSTLPQLAEAYKRALWGMLENFCQVTPSTYFLDTDGSLIKQDADKERAIRERPIWKGGELLPLPGSWGKAHPAEYREMEKTFRAYRAQVLKPLFREIDGCDNFIFCVDIPGILNNGPACLMQTQQTFRDLINNLAPSMFMRLVNFLGGTRPRLAYVATKSDLILARDRLNDLLEDFARTFNFKGIREAFFVCSACVSSEMKSRNGKNVLVGRDCDPADDPLDAGKLLSLPADLPNEWPPNWDRADYNFQEIAPKPGSAIRPPEQFNLNAIFEFIL